MQTGPRKALAQIQNPPSPPANVGEKTGILQIEEATGFPFESNDIYLCRILTIIFTGSLTAL